MDLSTNIQHVISSIELHSKLSDDIPILVEANKYLTDLIKELNRKCEFTEMSKLIADKESHSQSQMHLQDILEIARLPTTVNSLIHKNDPGTAMKLITHFMTEIYHPESQILNLVKSELDILTSKIHQKLNVDLESGSAEGEAIKILLGPNPSKETLSNYYLKKYRVRLDLQKQGLQRALFSNIDTLQNKQFKSEVLNRANTVLNIFTHNLKELSQEIESQESVGIVYKHLWENTLVKNFSDSVQVLLRKFPMDKEAIEF